MRVPFWQSLPLEVCFFSSLSPHLLSVLPFCVNTLATSVVFGVVAILVPEASQVAVKPMRSMFLSIPAVNGAVVLNRTVLRTSPTSQWRWRWVRTRRRRSGRIKKKEEDVEEER